MKIAIDQTVAVALPEEVRTGLGLQPGDEVLLLERHGCIVIAPVKKSGGLRWEENVLVHEGSSPCTPEEILNELRNERLIRGKEEVGR